MNIFKKVLVILAAIIVLGSSSVAYSWWDSLEAQNTQDDIVNLGQGLELVVMPVTINPITSGHLIPKSAILTQGATREIELTYTVKFNHNTNESLNLLVSISDIKVNNVENPFNLVSVIANYDETIANDDIVVTLRVTIDDAELDEENYNLAYLALAGHNISFIVSFQATRIN